jgi:hypothetical protein
MVLRMSEFETTERVGAAVKEAETQLDAIWEEALGRKLTDVEQDRQRLILRALATVENRLRAPSGGKMERRMDRERFQ